MTNPLKKKLVRGAGWNALQAWGRRIIGFVILPILAHLLGPEEYGLVATALIYIAFLEIFADQTFTTVIEQKQDLEPEHLDSLFWPFVGLGIVLTVGTIFLAPTIAGYFKEPKLTAVIRALSPGYLLLIGRGLQASLLRRELKIRPLAMAEMMSVIFGGAVGVTMAFSGFGVWSLVGQQLTQRLVSVGYIWRASSWQPSMRFSWPHLKELLPYGLSIMGHRLLEVSSAQFGRLLISAKLGNLFLGYYSVTERLMNQIVGMVVGANSMTLMPGLASLKDDMPKFRHLLNQACRYTALIAFPLFVGMSVMSNEIVHVVLGAKWVEAAPLMRVFALAGIVIVIQYMLHAALLALGRADFRLYINMANTFCNVVAFLVVIKYGIYAMVIAYTVRAWALAPLEGIVLHRMNALIWRNFLKAILAPTLGALGMGVAVWFLRTHWFADFSVIIRLIGCVAMGGVVYAALVLLVEPRFWKDTLGLLKVLKPDRNKS